VCLAAGNPVRCPGCVLRACLLVDGVGILGPFCEWLPPGVWLLACDRFPCLQQNLQSGKSRLQSLPPSERPSFPEDCAVHQNFPKAENRPLSLVLLPYSRLIILSFCHPLPLPQSPFPFLSQSTSDCRYLAREELSAAFQPPRLLSSLPPFTWHRLGTPLLSIQQPPSQSVVRLAEALPELDISPSYDSTGLDFYHILAHIPRAAILHIENRLPPVRLHQLARTFLPPLELNERLFASCPRSNSRLFCRCRSWTPCSPSSSAVRSNENRDRLGIARQRRSR